MKPDYCLNIGFTYRGLQSFEMPERTLLSFQKPDHQSFVNGSKAQAPSSATPGRAAPANWTMSDGDFDVILSLYVNDEDVLKSKSADLEKALPRRVRHGPGKPHIRHPGAR